MWSLLWKRRPESSGTCGSFSGELDVVFRTMTRGNILSCAACQSTNTTLSRVWSRCSTAASRELAERRAPFSAAVQFDLQIQSTVPGAEFGAPGMEDNIDG
jgi:hypothetical protein